MQVIKGNNANVTFKDNSGQVVSGLVNQNQKITFDPTKDTLKADPNNQGTVQMEANDKAINVQPGNTANVPPIEPLNQPPLAKAGELRRNCRFSSRHKIKRYISRSRRCAHF